MAKVGLALLATLLLSGGAIAQQGAPVKTGKAKHPLTDIPGRGEGVTVTAVFPEHAGHVFALGEKVPVLVGLRNGGAWPLNVTVVAGSINLPEAFSYMYLQNLTVAPFGLEVAAGQEVSLPYAFQVSPRLGAVKYQVALTVLYGVGDAEHGDTFFNRTLELVEAQQGLDGSSAVLVLAVAGAAAAYFLLSGPPSKSPARVPVAAHKRAAGQALTPKAASSSAKAPLAPAPVANEWLVGTSAHVGKKAEKKAEKAAKGGNKKA